MTEIQTHEKVNQPVTTKSPRKNKSIQLHSAYKKHLKKNDIEHLMWCGWKRYIRQVTRKKYISHSKQKVFRRGTFMYITISC